MDKRGRVVLSVVVLFVLLVSISSYFVLAAETNTKTYDSSTRTVTIRNGAAEIAEIKLDTPQINYVMQGKNRLVAEFTINNLETYTKEVLGKIDFYNLKDNNKPISRTFTYKYKVLTGTIDIPEYGWTCGADNKNNSKNCSMQIIGTHKENVYDWKPFTSIDLSNFPKRNTIIGIFVDRVYFEDYVEWVPTLYGVKVTEWATWVGGGEKNAHEQAMGSIGSGGNTEGIRFNISNVICAGNTTCRLIGVETAQASTASTARLRLTPLGTDLATATITNHNATFNYTLSTGINYFVVSVGASPQVGTASIPELFPFCVNLSCINGGFINSNWETVDYIAEFRSITITAPAYPSDNPPTITLNSPQNYVNLSSNSVAFNCTAQDDNMIQNVSLWINGEINYTLTDGVYNYTELYIEKTLGDGIYNWTCSAYDSASQIVWGINRTLMIDTTPPQTTVPIITPSNPTTNDNLQCYATLTDDKQTNLIAYWKWYKNNINQLNGNTFVINGNYSLITTLSAENTTKGEQWICEVTPFDNFQNGAAQNSTPVTILNSAPTQSKPLLSTPSGKNLSTEDLTCYNKSTSDADNDAITNIYNWYKNSQPLLALNLPFENNTNDYSGYGNDGTIYGATFTDGTVGRALSLDGVDDTVSVDLPNFPKSAFTFEMWFNVTELSNNGRDLFTKYSANDGFRTLITSSGQIESAWDIGDTFNTLTTPSITADIWHHFVVTYNGSLLSLYLDGNLKDSKISSGNLTTGTNTLTLGFNDLATPNFNGTIDEVRIYNYALTQQQINSHYNLEYNKILSQETSGGDNYMCQVTPNDGEADGLTLNSSVAEIKWGIVFNVRDSYTGTSLNNVLISCNSTNFNQAGDTTNTYGPYGFAPGNYQCIFSKTNFYNQTEIFNANEDKTITVGLSEKNQLTVEEHTWLEAIYNCLYSGDCSLYNLLLEVNQTTANIWQQTKPTDMNVIKNETFTNLVVDSTHNLTIDYTVNIPIKAGYSQGDYLPVRIGFWFMNESNNACYSQGTKPVGVEEPYCQPLIVETLGPMGGSVSFTVKLHPNLPVGNYSIKRMIDIDPNNIWINYGQETIGRFVMAEGLSNYGIALQKTGESNPSVSSTSSQTTSGSSGGNSVTNVYNNYVTNVSNNITNSSLTPEGEDKNNNTPSTAGITGGVIQDLLSKGNFIILITVIGLVLIVFIISRTIIKLKKK